MNTSDEVVDYLSDRLRELCNAAVSEARLDGRKTVMERDFRARR
jgi:histone H3/H4